MQSLATFSFLQTICMFEDKKRNMQTATVKTSLTASLMRNAQDRDMLAASSMQVRIPIMLTVMANTYL